MFILKVEEMRRMCEILRNFKCYNHLIDLFIDESQKQKFGQKDVVMEVEKLCLATSGIITQVQIL